MIKQAFRRNPWKEILYRNHNQNRKQTFKNELKSRLNRNIGTYYKSEEFFVKVQNKHAPLRKRKIVANHSCMTNVLQKTIIKRTQLQRKYFKSKAQKAYA